mgnify:CR=1 FL=1
MWLTEPAVFAVACLVQLLGLVSVALARVSERSSAQRRCQQIFLLCLLAVGVISLLAIHAGAACRILCATTLPLMALGATVDLHRAPQYSPF